MAVQIDPHDTHVVTEPAPTDMPEYQTEYQSEWKSPYWRWPRWLRPLPGVSTPNVALVGLQLIVGYEWLVSGVDKVLLGTFPASLPQLLAGSIDGGRLPGFFASLLQTLVLPNAQVFGVLIEWGETLAGLGLIAAAVVALLRPWAERALSLPLALRFSYGANWVDKLALVAAAGAGLFGLSFFLLDGLPSPWFTPSIAYGGAIDTGLFLALASAILIVAQALQRRRAQQ